MLSIPITCTIDAWTLGTVSIVVCVVVIDFVRITKDDSVRTTGAKSIGIVRIKVGSVGGPAMVNIREIDVISVEKTDVFGVSIEDLVGVLRGSLVLI